MKTTEALKIFAKNPLSILIDGIRSQREKYYKKVVESKFKIERLPSLDILDLLPNLNENINYYSFLPGTSTIIDLVLLKSFARKFSNCSYMEIGTWRGESVANIAEISPDCVCITLGADEMRQRKYSEQIISILGFFSKEKDNIKMIEHNSTTFDFSSLNKKFDLIFVDGDHTYNGVLNDTSKVFDLRKDENSIIVWHDYSNNFEDVGYEVFSGILDGIPADKHKNLFHISNTLCAVYIENNKLTPFYTRSSSTPTKNFKIHLEAERL